jgi:hypothetical protein
MLAPTLLGMTKPNPERSCKTERIGDVLMRLAAKLRAHQTNSSGTVERYADRAADPIAVGGDGRAAAALGVWAGGCSGKLERTVRIPAHQADSTAEVPHALASCCRPHHAGTAAAICRAAPGAMPHLRALW